MVSVVDMLAVVMEMMLLISFSQTVILVVIVMVLLSGAFTQDCKRYS